MAAPSRRVTEKRPRLAVLDGLRLLAALLVVLFHYVAVSGPAWGERPRGLFPAIYPVAAYGWLGVELFFVISGFVICMSAWGRPLGDFFVSRVARLYPVYWVGIALTTAAAFAAGKKHVQFSEFLANLTMLQTPLGAWPVSGVYWTLWIELHFYLLFAIVIWRGVDYRRAVTFCVLWTVASVLAQAVSVPAITLLVSPQYSMYFIAGIAMYLMYRFGPSLLLWAIVGVSFVLAQRHILEWAEGQARQTEGVVTFTGTMIGVTLIFLVMLAVALGWLSWIRGSWFAIAGAATYPLYLIHWETGWLAIERMRTVLQPWAVLAILIPSMVLVAWLLHRFLERPVQSRLRRSLANAIVEMRDRSDPDGSRRRRRRAEPVAPAAAKPPASTDPNPPKPWPAADSTRSADRWQPPATGFGAPSGMAWQPPATGPGAPGGTGWQPAVDRTPSSSAKPWPSTFR